MWAGPKGVLYSMEKVTFSLLYKIKKLWFSRFGLNDSHIIHKKITVKGFRVCELFILRGSRRPYQNQIGWIWSGLLLSIVLLEDLNKRTDAWVGACSVDRVDGWCHPQTHCWFWGQHLSPTGTCSTWFLKCLIIACFQWKKGGRGSGRGNGNTPLRLCFFFSCISPSRPCEP